MVSPTAEAAVGGGLQKSSSTKPSQVQQLRFGATRIRAYFNERAGIREYDGGLARPEAEHLAGAAPGATRPARQLGASAKPAPARALPESL